LQRLPRRADAEPRAAARRCHRDQGEPPGRAAGRPALRSSLFKARHRARENPRLKHWPSWLVPAIAALGFVALYGLDANRAVFLALNKIGPATSDALCANITVLGDGMVAFALCLPLRRRRPGLRWALASGARAGPP